MPLPHFPAGAITLRGWLPDESRDLHQNPPNFLGGVRESWSAAPYRLDRTAAARPKAVRFGAPAASASVTVSSISAWEVALLVKKGRLVLSMDVQEWVRKAESLPYVHFHPVDNAIALRSVNLPGLLHEDPADRIIVATALHLDAAVVTRDEKIRNYPAVRTIW
ncbi:MAG: type II toxin-antitoxin system VapC family toxin [Thermodesulfobacteriota bacterium]